MGLPDRVPRPLRLIPAAAATLVIADVLSIIDLGAVHAAYGAAAGAVAATALAGLRGARRARGSRASGRQREPPGWASFEVEVLGEAADATRFLEALKERSSHGSRYVIVTILGGGVRSYLVVLDSPGFPAEVEAEIVKSLATAVGGVRLSKAGLSPSTTLAELLDPSRPAQPSNAPLLASLRTPGDRRTSTTRPISIIGERVDSPTPTQVGLTEEDVRGHVGIFGSTGTGKTTTAAVLACSLTKAGFSVVILDWHGEYTARLNCSHRSVYPVTDPAPADPLALGDDDLSVEVIARALSLTPPQEYMLASIIERFRPRNLRDLYKIIEARQDDSRWDKEVRKALERKVGMLVKGKHAPAFTGSWTNPANGGSIAVVRMDEMRITLARRAYSLFVLASEFVSRSSGTHALDVVFILDEAHNIFNAPEAEFAGTLLAESRKYGMHFVVATQSPASIPNSVLLNTNTKIVHALRSARDRDLVASTLSLPEKLARWVTRLDRGEAILQAPSQPEPIVVRVKLG